MLGKKNKDNDAPPGVPDETLSDKSNFIIVGFGVLIFSVILILGLQIYLGLTISSQNKKIEVTSNAEGKGKTITLQIAKVGKDNSQAEYDYAKELETFMGNQEFQVFKNSISTIGGEFSVNIDKLEDDKIVYLGKKYQINRIKYETTSSYKNYTMFRKKLIETPFKINFEEEIIKREHPLSKNIVATGIIGAYVAPDKEKQLKKLAPSVKRIEKKLEIEKKKKEKQEAKKKGSELNELLK